MVFEPLDTTEWSRGERENNKWKNWKEYSTAKGSGFPLLSFLEVLLHLRMLSFFTILLNKERCSCS